MPFETLPDPVVRTLEEVVVADVDAALCHALCLPDSHNDKVREQPLVVRGSCAGEHGHRATRQRLNMRRGSLGAVAVQSAGTHWLSVGKKRHLHFPLTAGITFQLPREGCRVSSAWSPFHCGACWLLWLAGLDALSLQAGVSLCFLRSFVGSIRLSGAPTQELASFCQVPPAAPKLVTSLLRVPGPAWACPWDFGSLYHEALRRPAAHRVGEDVVGVTGAVCCGSGKSSSQLRSFFPISVSFLILDSPGLWYSAGSVPMAQCKSTSHMFCCDLAVPRSRSSLQESRLEATSRVDTAVIGSVDGIRLRLGVIVDLLLEQLDEQERTLHLPVPRNTQLTLLTSLKALSSLQERSPHLAEGAR